MEKGERLKFSFVKTKPTGGAYQLTDLQLSCKDFRNAFDQLLAERKEIMIRGKRRKYGIK